VVYRSEGSVQWPDLGSAAVGVHRPGSVTLQMTYLRTARSRLVLLALVVSSLLFYWFPDLDLRASGLFHRGGRFFLDHSWWTTMLHRSVAYFVGVALAAIVGIWAFDKLRGRIECRVGGRTVCYLFLVLILGAGLVVNVVLKDGFGRARPRNVVEFGGLQAFSPPFVVSGECESNCSFSSGDSSGAFFSLAFVLAFGRRRAMLVAALAYGALVSFSRIAAGAHFLSDTVISFFVMWITADALHHYMLRPREELLVAAAPGGQDPPEGSEWKARVPGVAPVRARDVLEGPPVGAG